jgi:CRP-like cAMP-binding protein
LLVSAGHFLLYQRLKSIKEMGSGEYFGKGQLPSASAQMEYDSVLVCPRCLVLTGGHLVFAGEISIMLRTKRTATIVAVTIADIASLSKLDFDNILVQFPDFAASIESHFHKYVRREVMGFGR